MKEIVELQHVRIILRNSLKKKCFEQKERHEASTIVCKTTNKIQSVNEIFIEYKIKHANNAKTALESACDDDLTE